MIRHPRRSVPAAVVAAVLLALAVLVVVAAVQALLGQVPFVGLGQLLALTSTQRWDGAATVAAAIIVAVLGLVLLVAAIRPGKPTVMPLIGQIGGQAATPAGVRRASLAKDLSAAAAAVPGVAHATVSARRNSVTARVAVAATDPDAVPGRVRERLDARLGEIGPAPRPRVRVRARRDKNT